MKTKLYYLSETELELMCANEYTLFDEIDIQQDDIINYSHIIIPGYIRDEIYDEASSLSKIYKLFINYKLRFLDFIHV